MQMQEACRQAGITRKAALVAVEAGLISPARAENGYRDLSAEDVERLRRISILRGLRLTTGEIAQVLRGEKDALQAAALRTRLARAREEKRGAVLERLARDGDWTAAEQSLAALRADDTVSSRLLEAFPGFFGQYVALHFAAFFPNRLETAEQAGALHTIMEWLDSVTPPKLSPEAQQLLAETGEVMGPGSLQAMHESVVAAARAPETWLPEHGEDLRAWQQAQKTLAGYAPLCEVRNSLRAFQEEQGYTRVFLPAMEVLSPAYAAYVRDLRAAEGAFQAAMDRNEKREKNR